MSPEQAIAPECPWYGLQQTFGEPNVKWCEERLCAWANEPANTWSNLPYIAVALWCLWEARRTNSRTFRHFGWSILLVGVTSLAYHATNNFGTQILDFVGMYVFVFLLVAQNLERGGWLARAKVVPVHVGLATLFTLLIPVMKVVHFPYQAVVAVSVFAIIGTEIAIARRAAVKPSYRHFVVGAAFLGAGAAFSAADVTRNFCTPTNHLLQGHAIWHCLGAVALAFTTLHYASLERPATAPRQAAVA